MNPYVNSLNGWGGGFIAYFPTISLEVLDEELSGGGGVFYRVFDRIIKEDISDRDYRIEKREGKKTREITAKKVLRELPKAEIKAKLAEFRQLDVTAAQARALLEKRAEEIIKQMRLERIEQLNQQTLAMILTAILADE